MHRIFSDTIRGMVDASIVVFVIFMFCTPVVQTLGQEAPDAQFASHNGVDLLERYPTPDTGADTDPNRARAWTLTEQDIFCISGFTFTVGNQIQVKTGPAELGVGHSADGAVFAIIIPEQNGQLTSQITNQPEGIANIWLRFNPKQIATLFPTQTVFNDGNSNLIWQMRAIAAAKIYGSWQAGGKAMIPGPTDFTVDIDTKNGVRRFFSVDTEAQIARYSSAFEDNAVRQPPTLTTRLAETTFDQLYAAFDRDYAMFVLRPEVNWPKLREEYRPRALNSKSTYEFVNVCAEMLSHLRDLHVWLTVAGAYVPVYNRPRSANANPRADAAILGGVTQTGEVTWAITTNQIGYIGISGWNESTTPAECAQALEQMRNTRGLIVDVRLNGGGSESLAGQFAGRFLEKDFIYAYSQFRNGPEYTNLTSKFARTAVPYGPWRYNRPVILLIGQKCMSSNESFIEMMAGDPEVTTIGDHTCGSSGDPEIIHLPLEMTVSVPQWIDYFPNGTPLDGRGVQPEIPFEPTAGAFADNRDDLLTAALVRLGQVALPDGPIQGPVFEVSEANLPDHSADINKEAQDISRPWVLSVSPTNDAEVTSAATELRIRFDRPMDPLSLKLAWEAGGFLECQFPKYDPDKCEFIIPIHLAPGMLQQIVINQPSGSDLAEDRRDYPYDGFQSQDHHLAGLFSWRFRTRAAAPSDAPAPGITTISPSPGSEVSFLTIVKVQFDQPMSPPSDSFPYLLSQSSAETPRMIPSVQYDAETHTFSLPLLLPAKKDVQFTLTGFRSAAGIPAKPIILQYRVSDSELSEATRKRIETGAKDPHLLQLLETMKQKRGQLSSLAERVQTLMLVQNNGLFDELQAHSAIFKWQKPNLIYADATGPMVPSSDFRIGSAGPYWWWHYESFDATNFVVCPANEMGEANISICDPFGLTHRTPAVAARELGLNFCDAPKTTVTDYPLIEDWKIDQIPDITPMGALTQWQIDPVNYRLAVISVFTPGAWLRMRFLYDKVDERMSAGDFAVPRFENSFPTSPEPLGRSYKNRFVQIFDGSNGRMSVRWGKKGPGGTVSGGLN